MNSISKSTKTKSKRKTKSKKSVKNSKKSLNSVNNDSNNCEINESKDKTELKDLRITKELRMNGLDNHLITEYYPTLSSTRKRLTSKALELERERLIKHYLNKKTDPKDTLAIEEFGDKGKGVVATKTIPKGSFICEYSGNLVDIQKAKSKEVKYALVGAGCYMYYFNWNNKIWCIDATQPNGRFGRLINHSRKAPNCKTKLIESNGRPHLVFIALKDIHKNDEILYDYGETDKDAIRENPWLTTT